MATNMILVPLNLGTLPDDGLAENAWTREQLDTMAEYREQVRLA